MFREIIDAPVLGDFSFFAVEGRSYWKINKQLNTVEPRSTDTSLIRTPRYCGQFRLSRRGKAHTFSIQLTRLIRTPVNTDSVSCPLGVRINRVPL